MEIRSLASWMTAIFMFAFWILRLVVAYTYATGKEFFVQPFNQQIEIVLLFVTFFCIILIFKGKMVGALIYLACYGVYFGTDLYNNLVPALEGGVVDDITFMQLVVSSIGIVLSVAGVMNVAILKVKSPRAEKTSWFYDNKDFDRKKDTRADKNNYKLL